MDHGTTAFAGYEIVRELGRGGSGVVFLARHLALDRLVALKVLAPSAALAATTRARFQREAQALARVRHRHVVQVHEVLEQDGRCAFAMELVEGASLADLIAAARVPGAGDGLCAADRVLGRTQATGRDRGWPAFLVRIGAELAEALAAVHAAGLVHRDVKPANVLVRRDGTALLADFGMVREVAATTATASGIALGTLAYAAPEQLRGGDAAVDARSDVYALGATLYHALALRLPFTATGTAQLLARIEAGGAIPLRRLDRGLPRDAEIVVAKAMDPDPDRRYQDAAELAQDLRRVLELRPIKARRHGPWVQLRRFCQRRPLATLAAGLLAMTVGLLTWAGQRQAAAAGQRAQLLTSRWVAAGLVARVPTVLRAGGDSVPDLEQWLAAATTVQEQRTHATRLLTELEPRGRAADPATLLRSRAARDAGARELEQAREVLARLCDVLHTRWPDNSLWLQQWLPGEQERLSGQAEALLLDRDPDPEFPDPDDQEVVRVARELVVLADATLRAQPAIEQRLAAARQRQALWDAALAAAWPAAIALAADPARAQHYRGLTLLPQADLVPLGTDPESGLLEFAHLPTGDPAARDPGTGQLRINAANGLVLVLIPGGSTTLLPQAPPPGPIAGASPASSPATPAESIELEPFFLSKYEMTQAQWLRSTGSNPSYYHIGVADAGPPVTGLHPVESILHPEALEVLAALDLVLPTAAQSEYASRAGAAGHIWTGPTPKSLEGCENVLDFGSVQRARLDRDPILDSVLALGVAPGDDGWARHAPVGTFRKNPFGLFDVCGNVHEWVLELDPTPYQAWSAPRTGDGLRVAPSGFGSPLASGGSWGSHAISTAQFLPGHRDPRCGVRPARRLRS